MTTMYSFYHQISRPSQSDEYLTSLAALARYSLAHIRSVTFQLTWEIWG